MVIQAMAVVIQAMATVVAIQEAMVMRLHQCQPHLRHQPSDAHGIPVRNVPVCCAFITN